jgi:hypothetical protein
MKINRIIPIILPLLLVVACDPGTGIRVTNNTGEQIVIECTTIYDTQFYEVEWNYDAMRGLLKHSFGGDVSVLAGPLELKPKGVSSLIGGVGTDILFYLKLGTIESIDDVAAAIDTIFTDINVYTLDNGTKTLLYDKSYFLDKKNIEIKSRFIRFDIKR